MRLTGVAAFGLACFCAAAQPAWSPAETRRLLLAPSLCDKAWGAWYVGASHDATLRATLIAHLRLAQNLRNSPVDSAGYAYVQTLFDALIQLPGAVPVDAIVPFENLWRPEVLILLQRSHGVAGEAGALLAMREHVMPDAQWTAVNDLLFGLSSTPFFQKTLEEIRVTHDFVITDQPVAFCGGTGVCTGSTRRFPRGFPPVALYQFWTSQIEPGDTLFLQDPVTVYYRRVIVPTNGEAKWSDCQFYPVAKTTSKQTWRRISFPPSDTWMNNNQMRCFSPGAPSIGTARRRRRMKWNACWPNRRRRSRP